MAGCIRKLRCYRLLGLALIAMFSILGFYWLQLSIATGISKDSYDKIETGMTKPQVIAILGCDPHYPPGQLKEFSLGGTVSSMILEREAYIWVCSNRRIYVRFNSEEIVCGKMWREQRPESFFEKMRRWLRIG
jgi:hypothetical protein